ncbi:MAG TPA: hypothetical protein VFL12_08805 [Thermoanaerobaculia bacterium]|nr:hypothetical protein [Thermoanaerobaculia bacterium]
MNKRWFLALAAALVAVPSFGAGRHSAFLTGGPEGGVVIQAVFSPADKNIVVACGYFGSIYYSEDGGQTWTRTRNAGALGGAFTAAFDPSSPSVVYAGATIGVGRSADSGKTWTVVSHGLPDNRVNALFVDPAHSGTVLAGTAVGLYRTTDSGADWSPFGTGLPAGISVDQLSADPSNPQTLLANTSYGTVFRSTDGGATWGNVSGLPPSPSIDEVRFDPTTPGRAFAGASTVYRSTDHGASWNAVSDSSFLGTVNEFAFLPGVVLVATNDALEKSTNGGVSWTKVHNGIPASETFFNGVAVSPGPSPIIIAAVEANGIVRSTDGGATWAVAKAGMIGNVSPTSIAIDPSNPKRVVAGLNFSGAVHTSDGGRSWTWIPDLGAGTVYSAIDVPGAAGHFVVGAFGTYSSTDGGNTWHQSSPQILDNVYALAAGTSTTHPLFAGTLAMGVWRSTDGGGSWHQTAAGLPSGGEVDALAVGPAPASVVYAGLSDGSVWRSGDSGGSWQPAGSPDSTGVNSMAADPNHANVLYAATENGVYKSTDGGSSWSSLNAALGYSGASFGMAMPAQEPGTVFVASFGGGAFVSHDDGATFGQIDPNFPRVLYSYLATTIATDATGQWIYEGSLGAGVFGIQPTRIDPATEPAPKKVKGGGR